MENSESYSLKKLIKRIDYEFVIYVIVWLFILSEPIFASIGRSEGFNTRDWLRDIPIFILFIINSVWLVPNLLFKKKILLYVGLVLLLSAASALLGEFIFNGLQHSVQAPPEFRGQMPRPPIPDFKPDMPPPRGGINFGFFTQIIIGLLVISLNTAIKVTIKWFKDEQSRREKEKEYLKSELTFLQNQISPHFFMNTLNNIHALIDINGKDAQLVIVKLSKMMRYLLYESSNENSTLKNELEFLESYIDLMKLRIDQTVSINLSLPKIYSNVKLPPLLLVPFIENAFKHGVSYKEKSYINIAIEQVDNYIIFECANSLIASNIQVFSRQGIGLSNVKKRLDLMFGDTYDLKINETINEFHVKLKIPVHED